MKLFGYDDVKKVSCSVWTRAGVFPWSIEKNICSVRILIFSRSYIVWRTCSVRDRNLMTITLVAIKERIASFMKDLDMTSLWKLGILAKTQHNEVAPAQHEMAPIFTTANISTDHNQLVMEIMKKVAKRHGLECLLHEKPFAGVNGSGKHNNWSIVTDTGINLLGSRQETT